MGFTIRTPDEILDELKGFMSDTKVTLIEGTFSMDVLESNALEFSKTDLEILEAYRNAFGHTCSAEYLDLKAGESGVYRREGKKAIGKLTVTGEGTVHKGAYFATAENIRFVATSETKVIDTAEIEIEALIEGAASNVAANTIIRIPMNIPGIKSCNNEEATYDGYDRESDNSLRERYLEKVRYPAQSGNPRSYIVWATSVVGVGAVRVQRCWAGAGTVKVVIVDSNFEPANVALLTRVTEKIQAERPIGAEVTVVSAQPIAINVSVRIYGSIDADAFATAVKNYLIKMTNQMIAIDESPSVLNYVSYNQIGKFILDAGADDYGTLTLNGSNENVPLGFDDIPALGEVTFT